MKLLVDADIVCFRFASVFSKEAKPVKWGDGIVTQTDMFDSATVATDSFIKHLQVRTFSTKVIMCFSSEVNFRYNVLPTYKHNRAGIEKPLYYERLKKYILGHYDCKIKQGLEADDTMGILATLDPKNTCIATIDKDLLQIPGKHFNWDKGWMCTCDPLDSDHYFYQQVLSGDPGDGYHGIPGIGAVKAEKLVKSFNDEDVWEKIVNEYQRYDLTEAKALQQARVARICRAEDYNYDKGEVILWTP